MHVHVSSRLPADAFGLGYEADYNGRAPAVQTVIEDFAKRFSLPAKMCTAFHVGKKLDGNELLLQVLGSRQVLALSIHFTPSLALYIWQSFRKGLWESVQEYADVTDVWVAAAEVCGTQGFIARSIVGSSAFLPALLAVEPLHTFQVDRLLRELFSSSPSDPFVLPQVQPLVRTLLLVAQLLATVAAERKAILASVMDPTDSTAGRHQLRSAIASRMFKLTDSSCCTPVLLPGLTTSPDQTGAPQPLPKPSKCVTSLRGAVLISKLATLTFNVKADLLGHAEPPGMPVAVQSLWHVMSTLVARSLNSLYESGSSDSESQAESSDSEAESNDSSISSWSADCEEHILCVHLCEHIVATLRLAVKEPEADFQTVACLKLLSAVLYMAWQKMSPQLLTYLVNKLGVLPLIMAFLDHRSEHAYIALDILKRLGSSKDPDCHHMDLLARLQGVRQLSNVFCTQEQASKGSAGIKTSSARRLAKAAAVIEQELLQQLDDSVYNTHDAVSMANSLLDLHPLSQRPPAEVSSVSTTHAQASSQAAKWPTPKPSEWKDIELVASRACTSLKWVLSLDSTGHHHLDDDYSELTRDLCQLIQRLVIGHLPDLDLDMQPLFQAGLQPVLAALRAGHVVYTGLAVAMLSRLGTDSTLISQSRTADALQVLSVFCGLCKASTPLHVEAEGASAMLRAAARALHFVLASEKGSKAVHGNEIVFMSAFQTAMSAFSDSLPDSMLLCACLGAIPSCDVITREVKVKGIDDAIFTTLEQVMQVPIPWDEELCLATATMLIRCCDSSFFESPSLSPRREVMQSLLVQLLQQLQGFRTTECRRLQRLLIIGCCRCLHALYMPSGAANCSAVVPAISDWLVVMEEADIVLMEEADIAWIPKSPKRDPMLLIPGLLKSNLTMEAMLHSLVCALTVYLDSQSKWHQLAQRGLEFLLSPLSASMRTASKQPAVQQSQDGAIVQLQYFDTLASASRHQALDPGLALKSTSGKAISVFEDDPHVQAALAAKPRVHAMWRRVACAAVVLLASRCHEARWLHIKYKDSRLEIVKVRQKKDHVESATTLPRLQVASSELLVQLRRVQQQIVRVRPALMWMEEEPAWPYFMADHQPQDWPGSEPPPDRHQDLVYLATENALSVEAAQAIHSFYSFMLGNAIAAAAAESLVADEASAAAKAAAKKAKKQKAKARKQQARSDVTSASPPPASQPAASQPAASQPAASQPAASQVPASQPAASEVPASQPSAGASLQTQQDAETTAAVYPTDSTGHRLLPDQQHASLPAQLHCMTVQGSVTHTLPVHVAMDEQEPPSAAAAAGGTPAGNAAAVTASQRDDASFLDQLFCCPITKVVMVDPVIAADGHTYERTAIQHWLQGSSLSPVTGDKLPHTRLVPNVLVKSALAQHAQAS